MLYLRQRNAHVLHVREHVHGVEHGVLQNYRGEVHVHRQLALALRRLGLRLLLREGQTANDQQELVERLQQRRDGIAVHHDGVGAVLLGQRRQLHLLHAGAGGDGARASRVLCEAEHDGELRVEDGDGGLVGGGELVEEQREAGELPAGSGEHGVRQRELQVGAERESENLDMSV